MPRTPGEDAPQFTTTDATGKSDFSLSDFVGKTVVLYFYNKDDSPGCTKEACSFRDSYNKYKSLGIVVLGVSADDKASHQAFSTENKLPFPLLVDTDLSIIKSYDVDGGGYAERVTYVIDGNGQIIIVDANVNTATHATDILTQLGK
mmetsp:Transcript_23284/g.31876  ORF Transcript_23284/g.31876 Transcript_23284/m.31876 type:complete len:147 (-) Transcript_23284:23-463(-)